MVRQSAWNMAAPPQRICVKLCVGIYWNCVFDQNKKITENLCDYLMFVYVHNGWPWLDFISEIVFRINCHKPINCHHQSTVTTNQLSQPINRHNQSINCHHQSTVTANHNDRWIGLGGPMAWSPTSPDLTPMPLFLRGHIKTLIYSSPFDSEAISLNICTKLVRSTFFFFRILQWFCLISKFSQTQFDGP